MDKSNFTMKVTNDNYNEVMHAIITTAKLVCFGKLEKETGNLLQIVLYRDDIQDASVNILPGDEVLFYDDHLTIQAYDEIQMGYEDSPAVTKVEASTIDIPFGTFETAEDSAT